MWQINLSRIPHALFILVGGTIHLGTGFPRVLGILLGCNLLFRVGLIENQIEVIKSISRLGCIFLHCYSDWRRWSLCFLCVAWLIWNELYPLVWFIACPGFVIQQILGYTRPEETMNMHKLFSHVGNLFVFNISDCYVVYKWAA